MGRADGTDLSRSHSWVHVDDGNHLRSDDQVDRYGGDGWKPGGRCFGDPSENTASFSIG